MGSEDRHNNNNNRSLKAKAKNRVDDLQGMFCSLQHARKESRAVGVAMLEEQINQMLREWKAELQEASPATSLAAARPSSPELSSDMARLLQLTTEEDDDATSTLAACLSKPTSEQWGRSPFTYCNSDVVFNREFGGIQEQSLEEEILERVLRAETLVTESSPLHNEDSLSPKEQLTSPAMCMQDHNQYRFYPDGVRCFSEEVFSSVISPPPEAFLGPKCALWDCPRPAARAEWLMDYCSSFHATLAVNEGAIGLSPVVRPGGIDLKDGPLFSSLCAKSHVKAVGIPECEGAATSKSPWNAHELFDISMLQAEILREWLFFDKPRRAFESGTRKQRSLPDHNGRGWHESRKQVMEELGGLKRSYYMDPQPNPQFEWHLYEYELTGYDACALYRLELKQVNTNKKNSRSKAQNDPVMALQNQIGRLSANLSAQDSGLVWGMEVNKPKNGKTRTKASPQSIRSNGLIESTFDNKSLLDYGAEDVSSYLVGP